MEVRCQINGWIRVRTIWDWHQHRLDVLEFAAHNDVELGGIYEQRALVRLAQSAQGVSTESAGVRIAPEMVDRVTGNKNGRRQVVPQFRIADDRVAHDRDAVGE